MSEPGGPLAGPDVPRCGAIGTKCLSCPDHSTFLQALSCLTGEMEEVVIADSREILCGLSRALPSQGSPRCLLTTIPRSSNRCIIPASHHRWTHGSQQWVCSWFTLLEVRSGALTVLIPSSFIPKWQKLSQLQAPTPR